MPDQDERRDQSSSLEEEREAVTDNGHEEPEIAVFRPDREGIRKVLGDLEAEIMEYVWEITATPGKGVTVREVYEAFRLRRVIAYTTVLSTMTRLSKKHLLHVRKEETAHMYTPVLSKASLIEKVVSRILENLLVSFAQTTQAQVKRLVTQESAQRLAALKETVADLRDAHALSAGQQTGSEQRTVTDENREEVSDL
jgi:predicted transcriptional regulator